jgi:hypothetical protein
MVYKKIFLRREKALAEIINNTNNEYWPNLHIVINAQG